MIEKIKWHKLRISEMYEIRKSKPKKQLCNFVEKVPLAEMSTIQLSRPGILS